MSKVYSVERASGVPRSNVIAEISRTMRTGGLALLPTETVYGVGVAVCAYNEDASYPCGSQTVNGARPRRRHRIRSHLHAQTT